MYQAPALAWEVLKQVDQTQAKERLWKVILFLSFLTFSWILQMNSHPSFLSFPWIQYIQYMEWFWTFSTLKSCGGDCLICNHCCSHSPRFWGKYWIFIKFCIDLVGVDWVVVVVGYNKGFIQPAGRRQCWGEAAQAGSKRVGGHWQSKQRQGVTRCPWSQRHTPFQCLHPSLQKESNKNKKPNLQKSNCFKMSQPWEVTCSNVIISDACWEYRCVSKKIK